MLSVSLYIHNALFSISKPQLASIHPNVVLKLISIFSSSSSSSSSAAASSLSNNENGLRKPINQFDIHHTLSLSLFSLICLFKHLCYSSMNDLRLSFNHCTTLIVMNQPVWHSTYHFNNLQAVTSFLLNMSLHAHIHHFHMSWHTCILHGRLNPQNIQQNKTSQV